MTHRARLVRDRVASLIDARLQPKGCHIYTDRRESLDPEQDEVPAISVDRGEEVFNLDGEDYIDSTLTVIVTAIVMLNTSQEVRENLEDLLEDIHKSICADRTLGLDFVIDIVVDGVTTSAPEVTQRGKAFAGAIASAWPIKYRMNFEDPGATGSVPNL